MNALTPKVVRVYLDSSDYSRLSSPQASADDVSTREELLGLARHELVEFVFSSAHISEMAPLDPQYTDSGVRRTQLLVDLCGKNCLMSVDRLIGEELQRAAALQDGPLNAVSHDGTWFPDVGGIATPSQALQFGKEVMRQGKDMGLSRKARRMLKSKATRHGMARKGAFEDKDGSALAEVLQQYPMRPEDAKVIREFAFGRATPEAADEAFLSSLRDPTWMMQWFRKEHQILSPISNWVRLPAQKMVDQLGTMIAAIRPDIENSDALRAAWDSRRESFPVSIAKRVLAEQFPGKEARVEVATLQAHCPGFWLMLGVFHESVKYSIGPNARTPSKSDFVDAVHSIYAPYVSVFRADKYMAPIVASLASTFDVKVISNLRDVPSTVRDLLTAP